MPATAAQAADPSVFAVRSSFDDITQGSSVAAGLVPADKNGVQPAKVAFYGAGQAGLNRSEIYFVKSQYDGLTPGAHPVSTSGAAGSIGVDYNYGGQGCGAVTSGSVTVLTAPTYDGSGAPATFAADITLHCGPSKDFAIQLRFHDTHAWAQLTATTVPSGISATVGEVQNATVVYTADGTTSITPGAAALSSDSWAGYDYWSITSDGCHGHVLAPGSTCQIGVRFAPQVPNGSPCGSEAAVVSVPDNLSLPAVSRFSGCAYPMPGQAGPIEATSHFHSIDLVWNQPGLPLGGFPGNALPTYYEVYRPDPNGNILVTTTPFNHVIIGGLATGYTGQYLVRAVYNEGVGSTNAYGAYSVLSNAVTTSSRQLFYANRSVFSQSLDPVGAAASFVSDPSVSVTAISVGNDQRYMAIATEGVGSASQQILVTPVDGSTDPITIKDPLYGFLSDPNVSPTSNWIVYTAATSYQSTDTVLRVWSRSANQFVTVPHSAGLKQAATTPDGGSLIAVATAGDGSTYLVHIVLGPGTLTTVTGGTDATQPIVALDGRIAMVHHTSGSDNTTLEVLPAGGGTPTPIDGVPTGVNTQPSWDPANTHVDYVHQQSLDYVPTIHEVSVTGGTDIQLAGDGEQYFTAPVVVGTSDAGDTYQPNAAPARVYDSRQTQRIPAHGIVRMPLSTIVVGNVEQPEAVQINVTVTGSTAGGYITVYPDGGTMPTASTLNFGAAQTTANEVTALAGSDGYVDFYNGSAGSIDMIVDYFGAMVRTAADTYFAHAPDRLIDTRSTGKIPAHGSVTVEVGGIDGVPAAPAAAVLNIAATDTAASGYLTAYPDGGVRPSTSNSNWTAGATVSNLAVVPMTDGKITLYNGSSGPVDFIADLVGYYQAGNAGARYYPKAPSRLLDTRSTVKLSPGQTIKVPVAIGVTAAALNLTAVNATATGYLIAYPDGTSRPNASSLNYVAGQAVANMSIMPVGADGAIEVYNGGSQPVDLIVDLNGVFGGGS